MLVLTRRRTESIVIGAPSSPTLLLQVLHVSGDRVAMLFPLIDGGRVTATVGETLTFQFEGTVVVVFVAAAKGNQATFRIGAPRSVPIHRKEVAERIAKEELAAVPSLVGMLFQALLLITVGIQLFAVSLS